LTDEGNITSVEFSLDNGATWKTATLQDKSQKYQGVKWSYSHVFEKNHESSIKVRAFDSIGQSQPDKAFWNRNSCGYNEVSRLKFE
jgi:sulfite oxidase